MPPIEILTIDEAAEKEAPAPLFPVKEPRSKTRGEDSRVDRRIAAREIGAIPAEDAGCSFQPCADFTR